jgi:hypothetical protein
MGSGTVMNIVQHLFLHTYPHLPGELFAPFWYGLYLTEVREFHTT